MDYKINKPIGKTGHTRLARLIVNKDGKRIGIIRKNPSIKGYTFKNDVGYEWETRLTSNTGKKYGGIVKSTTKGFDTLPEVKSAAKKVYGSV
tara:strand:- start:234 stop:509 length:276 start_codon:yes stop_codon:yes gene_type:complete